MRLISPNGFVDTAVMGSEISVQNDSENVMMSTGDQEEEMSAISVLVPHPATKSHQQIYGDMITSPRQTELSSRRD